MFLEPDMCSVDFLLDLNSLNIVTVLPFWKFRILVDAKGAVSPQMWKRNCSRLLIK